MPSSTKEIQNKKKEVNKGGRPRLSDSPGGKTDSVKWKHITEPAGGLNHYEISTTGQVRRRLKSGTYKPVKTWVQGSSYGAVYLYGYPNAHRHRKKVYIHRLVATHFVKGRKPLEVVHHKRGPQNNNAKDLQWVSVEANLKARKFLDPKTAKPRVRDKKKVKNNVQSSNASQPNALKEKAQKTDDTPPKLPAGENLPDKDEFIPNTETLEGKIRYLVKVSKEFRTHYKLTRDHVKKMGIKLKTDNFAKLFKQATGKNMKKLQDARSPYQWRTKLISALHSIKTRLKA